jgi:hypothetical protein
VKLSQRSCLARVYPSEATDRVRRKTQRDRYLGFLFRCSRNPKVHLTETCEASRPRVIVHVETTPATTPDDNMLEVVHASLAPCHLLPSEHLVDKGYGCGSFGTTGSYTQNQYVTKS